MQPLRPDDPTAVGPYRLVGRLGTGGQGVVYLGEAADGRAVAVKVLLEGVAGDGRFAKEVDAARRVEPFCVAQVLDASPGPRPYIVTEYVDGPSLQEAGRHAGGDLRRLAVATATALAAVHAAGIVHRDFKPANVLLGRDGPRVIDFGIARVTDAALTHTSGIMGTPAYMAPEQLAGQVVGPATDVFAWGAVIVFAATGEPPFGQDALPAVINRILHNEPRLGDLQEPLRSIVYACLVKDPAARPAMQDVLLRLLGGPANQAWPATAPPAAGTPPAAAPTGMRDRTGPASTPERTGPGRRRRAGGAVARRWVLPAAVAGGVVMLTAAVTAVVVTLPDRTPAGTVAVSGTPGTPSPTPTSPEDGPAESRTREPSKKPTTSPKPKPRPTTTKPTEQPTAQPTEEPTKKPASVRLTIRPIKVWDSSPRSPDCTMPPVNFETTVESNRHLVRISARWIVDGKTLDTSNAIVPEEENTAFMPSRMHMLDAGPHTVTFKIVSPVVKSSSVRITVCRIEG